METIQTPVPFARPFIGKEEEEAVLRVLRSGWLTTGPEALAFEEEFAQVLRGEFNSIDSPAIFCMAVNSATSGLHLALEACGVKAGDVVLLPSYTFAATAEVVRYLGAEPVFVDSLPGGFNIDPLALENTIKQLFDGTGPYSGKAITGKPKAIIPVHFGGLPCDMRPIMDIAHRYELKVIEDAAHSFPSIVGNGEQSFNFAGTIADAGVFSFYATKTLTTGEGGMIACKDQQMAKRIAVMRSHGIDRNVWDRYTNAKASWRYQVTDAGYKYNMPDLLAALGRVQLGRAFDLLSMRAEIAARYNSAFSNDSHFIIPPDGPGNAWHLYPLRLNPASLRISRDEFIASLQDEGIGVSVHFIPLHTMPYYRQRYQIEENALPHAMTAFSQEISLPIWPGMTDAQIDRVIDVVYNNIRNLC